jgi:hypothetical protein
LLSLFIFLLALLLLGELLRWLDKTTELAPNHDRALQFCLLAGGIASLLFGSFAIRESKGIAAWRRVGMACCFAVAGFLSVFLLSSAGADLIESRIDFPPATTKTHMGLLIIWRAYCSHGKRTSWHIQTTPLWSDLDITQADYEFMSAHRSPDDPGLNPDEVSSHGYFCARAILQESGTAVQVLGAGSHRLPQGTVVVCPARILK